LKNYFFNNIAFGQFRFAELLSLCNSLKGREKKIGYSAVGGILLLRNSEPTFEGTGISF
jgi:hypothetical protein